MSDQRTKAAKYRERCQGCGYFSDELPNGECEAYGTNGHHMIDVDENGFTIVEAKAALPEPGVAGHDVCDLCGAIFPAYTLMYPCMTGCCRFAPERDHHWRGWVHTCCALKPEGCDAPLSPEHQEIAKRSWVNQSTKRTA